MKRLMISGLAAIVLFAAATTMLRSRSLSTDPRVGAPDMTSLQEHYTPVDVNKLPTDNVDDMSLVYSNAPKH